MNFRRKKNGLLGLLLLSLSLVALLTYLSQPHQLPDLPRLPAQGNTATIFLIDGLSNDIFRKAMQQGKLPHIAALAAQGRYVENGIGSFPSMTGYAFFPFVTGTDAVQSGILGLRWFDRQRKNDKFRNYVGRTHIHMNTDILPEHRTFFEQYQPYYTASINSYMNRGVQEATMTGWAHTTAKYEGKSIFGWLRAIPYFGKYIAKNHFEHETAALEIALQQVAHNPKVHWITFPSPDAYNHVFGTDSTYWQLLTHIDSLIGRYVAEVNRLGQGGQRLIAIVSDHGISDVGRNIDICQYLYEHTGMVAERGTSVNVWTSQLTDDPILLDKSDAYFVINGNLCGYLYLKGGSDSLNAWTCQPDYSEITQWVKNGSTYNLLQVFANMEGIELVAARQSSTILSVQNQQGIAHIARRQRTDGVYTYRYDTLSADPLRYGHLPSLVGYDYTASEWLIRTANTDFPYAVPRLFEVMAQDKSPDLLFTSAAGYDVANDYEMFVGNYKGGHGGIRAELLSVPYIVYTPPQQKPDTLSAWRSEDLGAWIKQHLLNPNFPKDT